MFVLMVPTLAKKLLSCSSLTLFRGFGTYVRMMVYLGYKFRQDLIMFSSSMTTTLDEYGLIQHVFFIIPNEICKVNII